MLIIRFARRGRKGQAFFDLVVAEKSRPLQKKFVSKLGFFNPRTEGGKGEFVFDKEAVEKQIANGAQVSQSAARLLVKNGCEKAGKFVEQRASKPQKTEAPKEEPVVEAAPVVEEPVAEEAPAAEEPAKEAKAE
jgi:small subunit ribosomal protein S16